MPKPAQPGSKCTGRCHIVPGAHQPSPLVPDLIICKFCKQVTKKGEMLPAVKKDASGEINQG